MNTTTFAAIRDQMASKLALLTTSGCGGRKFVRSKQRVPLREWSAVATEAGFRAFEIVGDEIAEPSVLDPAAYLVTQTITIRIAYPLLRAIYGSDDLDDVEGAIQADLRQVRDTVFSSGNYLAGQEAATPQSPTIDRSGAEVWFVEMPFAVQFYASQTLV